MTSPAKRLLKIQQAKNRKKLNLSVLGKVETLGPVVIEQAVDPLFQVLKSYNLKYLVSTNYFNLFHVGVCSTLGYHVDIKKRAGKLFQPFSAGYVTCTDVKNKETGEERTECKVFGNSEGLGIGPSIRDQAMLLEYLKNEEEPYFTHAGLPVSKEEASILLNLSNT